jgi:hypothetical protein
MRFEAIGNVEDVEVIAKGRGVDIRYYLNREYGAANWRKLKGIAVIEYKIEYKNGEVWLAEIHWYEAEGKGRKKEKDKRKLRRIA